jgi:hypothetical protein
MHFQSGPKDHLGWPPLTYRILFVALVTCLPTYRTMARYFEFLSQFYGFHLTHPRT